MILGGLGGFGQSGIVRGVSSYWNRKNWHLAQPYSNVQTGSGSPTNLMTAIQFLAWDESFHIWNSGYALNNSVSCYCVTDMFLNGSQTNGATIGHSIAAGAMFDTTTGYSASAGGNYNATALYGWVNGGIGTWNGMCGVSGRG
jgi:hypothetical protein